MDPETNFPYTLVETTASLSACVDRIHHYLSQCKTQDRTAYLYLDCEGRDLGRLGGTLALLQIGFYASGSWRRRSDRSGETAVADVVALLANTTVADTGDAPVIVKDATRERNGGLMVYLIDPIVLSREALDPIYAYLRDTGIVKVMWDGRMDSAQLAQSDVMLRQLLDLQVVEINRRIDTQDHHPFFVHQLLSLRGATLGESLFPSTAEREEVGRVDGEVKGYHRTAKSAQWLSRPLRGAMLTYAALDIYSLAKLHERYARRGWCDEEGDKETWEDLVAMSGRYCSLFAVDGELRRADDKFMNHGYLPIGVLHDQASSAKGGEIKWVCAGCRRTLLKRLFHPGTPKHDASARFCPVCQRIRMREKYRRK